MWNCPLCRRNFKTANQSHSCSQLDIGELFLGKPDALVLAFAEILEKTNHWSPNTYGAATKAVVFASKKAWLIVRPMQRVLDVKFYLPAPLNSPLVKKIVPFNRTFAHHLRLSGPEEVTEEVLELLAQGFAHSVA